MVTYPEDWSKNRLDDFCTYVTGTSLEEYFSSYGNRRVISLGNYSEEGKYIDDGNRIILNQKTQGFLLFKDDLSMVLNDKGNGRLVGKVLLIDENNKYVFNQRSLRIIPEKSKVAPLFLYYLINSGLFRNRLKPHIQGNTQVYINPPAVMSIPIYIPSLQEQQAIASVLSIFDEHIDNLKELIEKKKLIRDGALEDLVSGRTRIEGFTGEWEEKSFKDLGDILTGLTYKPDNIRPYGKLVIRSSNVQDDRLSFEDNVFVDRTCVTSEDIKKGDIIICVSNGSASLIGKSAYASSDLDATFGAFMSNFRCKNYNSSGFIYYFTKSVMFKKFVKQILGVTINNITKTDLKRVTLNIPVDIKEQQVIAEVLTAMDEEIESLKIEKEKMIQIKEGVMDDLLTGRVRLKV